ncbi:hypothetical protein COCNU_11G011480 [Cocos nucifera]|uniref:Uncharacterized protein n=1 Tax=Cocos nucifera TaxID=13894 RepID=A0A8K0IQ43_COCNU|nr:hypothetical protein COCNU_11G011480 [Cocos nucifera]
MVQYLWLVSFVVGLLLSLAPPGDSLALANGGVVTLRHNDGTFKSGQGLQDETKMVDATRNIWHRGRKMGMKKVNEVKDTVETGANYSVGKCGHGGERVGCKPNNRGLSKRIHFVGLIPFSSDYRRPDSSITTLQSGQLISVNKKSDGNALEPVNLSNAPFIKSQVFEASSTHASLGSSKVLGPSHGQFQIDETQKLLASTAEIFKMLQKDYHQHAHRRPPINNHLPLASFDVKP